MTIEATLASIDASLKTLVQIAQTAGSITTELAGAPAAAPAPSADAAADKKPGRPRKNAEAPAAAPATQQYPDPKDLVAGDPEGTTYYVIEKHNSVARVLPGDSAPSIEGQRQISGTSFTEWKNRYDAMKPAADKKADTTAAGTGEAPAFKLVTESLVALMKHADHGRPALDAVLAEYGVAKVPALEALGKNQEILDKVNALLNPATKTEDDPFAA